MKWDVIHHIGICVVHVHTGEAVEILSLFSLAVISHLGGYAQMSRDV